MNQRFCISVGTPRKTLSACMRLIRKHWHGNRIFLNSSCTNLSKYSMFACQLISNCKCCSCSTFNAILLSEPQQQAFVYIQFASRFNCDMSNTNLHYHPNFSFINTNKAHHCRMICDYVKKKRFLQEGEGTRRRWEKWLGHHGYLASGMKGRNDERFMGLRSAAALKGSCERALMASSARVHFLSYLAQARGA